MIRSAAWELDRKPPVSGLPDDLARADIAPKAGYSFRFRASDRGEPPHVHVSGNGGAVKIWLAGLEIASSQGYNQRQLRHIISIAREQAGDFMDQWHEFFD